MKIFNQKNNFHPLRVLLVLLISAVFFIVGSGSARALLQNQLDGGGDGGGYAEGSYYSQGSYAPPVVTQCNDGIDNDGNGPVDYPADLGCTSGSDTTEAGYATTLCSNTLDDDGDGYTDLADTGCANAADTTEIPNPQCSDGADNDLNGVIDYSADLGCTSAYDTTEAGYVPPATPGSGVVVYSDRPDYANKHDALINGGVAPEGSFDSTMHGTGSSPSPSGQRTCYLVDPTSYESYWESGGYHSCNDNNEISWTGTSWYKGSACSPNNHYHIISCTTLAVPDTTLTANGSSSEITVTQGTPVTLTWNSVYGQVRHGTFTATNFSLVTWSAGYCVDEYELYCPGQALAAAGSATEKGKQLALGNTCSYRWVGQTCYPPALESHPYGSSTTTTPTQTTTYTYTGTNANGSSFSSVKVNVAGTTECTDLVSNGDNDTSIDAADPGCSINPPGCSGQSCVPTEHTDMPDLTASNVTQNPATPTATVASTLSATITNIGGATTGAGFTNLFQIDNNSDHTSVTATVTGSSPVIAAGGTNVTNASYTFPSSGTWYVRACADNNASWVGTIREADETTTSGSANNCDTGLSSWHTVTVNSGVPVASLTASPTSVPTNDSSTLTWSCTNSTGASIDHGIGSVWVPAGTGSVSTGPLSQTTSYTLTCSGTGGSAPGFFTVTITVPTVTITANGVADSLTVKNGTSVTIAWTASADATSCTVTGPSPFVTSNQKNSSESVTVTNLSTYTINCNGVTKTVKVSLAPVFKEI